LIYRNNQPDPKKDAAANAGAALFEVLNILMTGGEKYTLKYVNHNRNFIISGGFCQSIWAVSGAFEKPRAVLQSVARGYAKLIY